MKTCQSCSQINANEFEECWRCKARLNIRPDSTTANPSDNIQTSLSTDARRRVAYEAFDGFTAMSIYEKAAKFASSLGPHRLISISESAYRGGWTVTVWYWTAEEEISK